MVRKAPKAFLVSKAPLVLVVLLARPVPKDHKDQPARWVPRVNKALPLTLTT